MRLIPKFGVVSPWRALLALAASFFVFRAAASAQEIVPPSTSGVVGVRLEAEQQRKEGDIYFADGKVEIQYKNLRLRADHLKYNTTTHLATANGHVLLDVETQHLAADSGDFDVVSGEGHFEHVRGEVMMEHKPNPCLLYTSDAADE